MIEATYIDHMGTDLTVANAARVSFDKQSECYQLFLESLYLKKNLYGEYLML